jgi:hypothetical protein
MDDRNDLNLGAMTDVNLGRRKNVTDDRNDLKMDVNLDVSLCHRMNDQLDDQNLDASHVNRNYAPRDRKTDENSDVKNLHAKYY